MILKRFHLNKIQDIGTVISELASIKFPVHLYIGDDRQPRTIKQNRYLRLIEKWLSEETGHYPNEIHEDLITMFSQDIIYTSINNSESHRKLRTHEMDTKQLTIYIDKIRIWAAEFLNYRIPLANELTDEQILNEK